MIDRRTDKPMKAVDGVGSKNQPHKPARQTPSKDKEKSAKQHRLEPPTLTEFLALFGPRTEVHALVKAFLITRAEDHSFTKYDQQIREICASDNADKLAAKAFLDNLFNEQRIDNLAKDLTAPSLKTKARTLLYHLSRLFDRSAKSPDARNNESAQDGLKKIFNSENTKS